MAAILPGLKPVREMLLSDPGRILKVYCKKGIQAQEQIQELCSKCGIPLKLVDEKNLIDLCKDSHLTHQGVVAELVSANIVDLQSLLSTAPLSPLPLILALDQLQDPGNLGALARTAWSLGCAGLIIPQHNSAAPGPVAFKTSAGALALISIHRAVNLARALDAADEAGFHIYGAAISANSENAFTLAWQTPTVLVLGGEAKGLRPGVAKRCHEMATIPLARHFDSLNVAQAGAIFMALYAAYVNYRI